MFSIEEFIIAVDCCVDEELKVLTQENSGVAELMHDTSIQQRPNRDRDIRYIRPSCPNQMQVA